MRARRVKQLLALARRRTRTARRRVERRRAAELALGNDVGLVRKTGFVDRLGGLDRLVQRRCLRERQTEVSKGLQEVVRGRDEDARLQEAGPCRCSNVERGSARSAARAAVLVDLRE